MKWASVLKEVSETITCFCALCFAKGGVKFTAFLRYLTLKNPLCSQQFCGLTFYKTYFRIGVDQKIEMDKMTFSPLKDQM